MSRKPLRIYSNDEFKSAGKLDRIHMWMIEQDRFDHLLTDAEEKYYRVLQQAYSGCYNELRRSQAIKYIQNNIIGYQSPAGASKLLDDMQELFGRFLDKNLALKQAILVEKMYEDAERLIQISKEMKESKNYEGAAKAIEQANNIRDKAAKIEGLDKVDKRILVEEITIPQVIVTSDVKVLEEAETAE